MTKRLHWIWENGYKKFNQKFFVMRTTNSIQFYCRKSKENKNGESPLEMSICLNGERKFINLPIKFKPEEFNRKRQPQTIVQEVAKAF